MRSWQFALEDSELAEASMKSISLGEASILVVKSQGKIFAADNKCPHMECLLSAGKLEGFIVQCPCHDWKFDIRTGEFIDAPEIKINVYETKIEEGKIYVQL